MKLQNPSSPHNVFKIVIKPEQQITIRSDFDSGNMGKVELLSTNVLLMTPAHDCAGTEYEGHSKSWFYFKVSGVPPQTVIKFIIKKIHMLASQSKFTDHYKPVFQIKGQCWKRAQLTNIVVKSILTQAKQDDTQLHFQHKFQKSLETSFAFALPYSYQQLQKHLKALQSENKNKKDVYFHSEIMIKSPQNRNIHLITISSYESRENTKQKRIDESLFPNNLRPYKFKPNKRVILISARVHPGQTPGSHVMNGLIDFLVSKDARAMILRKNFVFMLVPMLNPDGVYHGHYRMDIYNQNLNRFYLTPNSKVHPGPFGVKCLAQYLQAQKRLCFFMDLHAHAGRSGNFFYGNALEQITDQVQTQMFAKIMSLNCVNFQFQSCNFSIKQMTSKDRNEELTKQGSSRVALYKISKIVHIYTLQCGYHYSIGLNDLKMPTKYHRKVQGYGILYDELQNLRSPIYQNGNPYFTIQMYENIGKAISVSILDTFDLNPYSRITNTQYKDLQGIRKQIQDFIFRTVDRFKKPISYKKRLTAPQMSEGTRQMVLSHQRVRYKLGTKSVAKIQSKKSIRIRGLSMPRGGTIKNRNR